MIKFHPDQKTLHDYAVGVLSPAESLIVAAHCDMCSACHTFVTRVEQDEAQKWLENESHRDYEDAFPSGSDMVALITSSDVQRPPVHMSSFTEARTSTLELDGRVFTLPRTLRKYASKTGNWSGLVGKLWQAPVEMGCSGAANFIYMAKGGSVPEHTHRGTELTLVINGKFEDGINEYQSGDFVALDSHHVHSPRASSAEGCLVFSIVDQPLHFTSGIARLLNPFSHLFFR